MLKFKNLNVRRHKFGYKVGLQPKSQNYHSVRQAKDIGVLALVTTQIKLMQQKQHPQPERHGAAPRGG